MKQEKIIAAADILAIQMNHWTLFAVIAAAAILSRRKPPLALWAVCGLLPVLFFFIRRYTNGFLLLAVSHLLCLACLFAVPVSGLALKLLLYFYGAGLAVYSFSLRIRTEERLDGIIAPVVAVGIIALSLFLLHFRGYQETDFYFICMAAFYFICYHIRCYLNHYLYFIAVNSGSAGYIPRREIFLAGTRLSFLFTLSGMAAVLLLSNLDWLARFFAMLKEGIIWLREHGFFAFLASLFAGMEEHFTEPIQNKSPAAPAGMYLEAGEAGLFWQILEKIFELLVPLFLLGMLLAALYRFVRMVRERFRQKKTFVNDAWGNAGRDIRERYEAKHSEKKTRPPKFWAFLSPDDKIRRIYRQRIGIKKSGLPKQNQGNTRPFESYTARECGNLFQEENLSLLYEKARYSNMKCTPEDVRNAGKDK